MSGLNFEEKAHVRDMLGEPEHEGHNFPRPLTITKYGRDCTSCGQLKVWSDYYRRKSSSTGYMARCKRCVDLVTNAWRRGESISFPIENRRKLRFRWVSKGVEQKRLVFPAEVFATGAKYVSIEIDAKATQVILTAFLTIPKRGLSYRKLLTDSHNSKVLSLNFPKELAEKLQEHRAEFQTSQGKLIIQFYDTSLLSTIETWAISKAKCKDVELLRIYQKHPSLTFSPRRWVEGAEHVKLEYTPIRGKKYLDLIPLNREGFVVFSSGKVSEKSIGLRGANKLLTCRRRLVVCPYAFLAAYPDIPRGDWYLTNNGRQRPDGRFRYRPLDAEE